MADSRNLHDIIAWDAEIHRISQFSVWQDEGGLPEVRIIYLAPREERTITLASPLSADYLGLELHQRLSAIPELGTVDFRRGQGVWPDGTPRTGWNFVAHYGREEERAWKRSIGAL